MCRRVLFAPLNQNECVDVGGILLRYKLMLKLIPEAGGF